MFNGEGDLTTLQLMPLSTSHRRPKRPMESAGIEIPSKRACWETAPPPPSSHDQESSAAELRELDLFPMERIETREAPAINFMIERGNPATDLRLCSTANGQWMEDWEEKAEGKGVSEEVRDYDPMRVARGNHHGRLKLIGGLMPRNHQRGSGGGSPPLSGEDDDHPLEMHKKINGGGTTTVPPPENSKMAVFDGCSCGGVGTGEGDEPAQEHTTLEEVRIAFRDRSEASSIPDKWRWRKYGQKGKPPRSYYRCTMTSTCLVRKQVQRCAQDKSILITTYVEWNHDHPLPPSAMPTTSIISEAASMFLSGSISPVSGGLVNINTISPMIPHCRTIMTTISFSARCPTVTLDLTKSPDPTHPPPQFQAPTQPPQPALPPLFSRLLYEQYPIVSGAMANGEGPHNLDDIASVATEAILTNPKFKVGMVALVKSIISEAHQGGGSYRQYF